MFSGEGAAANWSAFHVCANKAVVAISRVLNTHSFALGDDFANTILYAKARGVSLRGAEGC